MVIARNGGNPAPPYRTRLTGRLALLGGTIVIRWRALSALVAVALLGGVPARAGPEQDWGECKSRDSDKDRIIAACTRVVGDKRTPAKDRAIAFNNRGFAYQDKKDFARAIADYTAALRLDPDMALVYLNRAFAYKEKGDFDRALADGDRALELDPENRLLLRGRGDVYRARGDKSKGDYDNAIADYSEAIRLDPQDGLAYRSRGMAYQATGELERATADYNKFMELQRK
jgi:tetratricopeptide (TPR) repeat protein